MIFQYCCFGDLLNYLKTNSERYHKSVTDAFNKDRFTSLYHNLQLRKRSGKSIVKLFSLKSSLTKQVKSYSLCFLFLSEQQTADNYVPMHSASTRGQEDIALLTLNSTDTDSYEGQITPPEAETAVHVVKQITYNQC